MKKDKDSDMPDSIRPLLDEVAERLWSNQAAVMVGAVLQQKRGLPAFLTGISWEIFFMKRFMEKSRTIKNRYLNVLKLADEMKAGPFGRPALNQVLRETIPDLEHKPSSLHVELLNLPWTDVFTTNYDTLLERAGASVISRRYDVVINPKDLVYSENPRIIKPPMEIFSQNDW